MYFPDLKNHLKPIPKPIVVIVYRGFSQHLLPTEPRGVILETD